MNVEDNTRVRNQRIKRSQETNNQCQEKVSKTILITSRSKIKIEGGTIIADNLLKYNSICFIPIYRVKNSRK